MTRRPQFEVIPLPGAAEQVSAHLPPGARVTVTSSPAQGAEATVTLARTLSRQGFTAVPHLAARQITDEAALGRTLEQLAADGIGEVFVIAGDAAPPAGDFDGALPLLEALDRSGHEFTIGIGGHPEGHPFLPEPEALRLLQEKSAVASYLVTQMCFEAEPLLAWVRQLRAQGVQLPVRPGVAGPAGMRRLLRIGTKVGVGRSLRMLGSHGGGMRKMLGPGSWSPDPLLDELAPAFADVRNGLDGLHVYTFNALADVATWWGSPAHRTA